MDFFVVISDEIEAELLELGYPKEKLFRNPNGVDTQKFSPCSAEEKEKLRTKLALEAGPIVLFIGRLSVEKRADHLINIWPDIRV